MLAPLRGAAVRGTGSPLQVIHKGAAQANAPKGVGDGQAVAAAGRIYFTSEDGVVYVVRAGRAFELMASNDMREVCMATPAIANDMMIVRTRTRVYGLIAAR
jgi:outer membrane protein assembly factor BamB